MLCRALLPPSAGQDARNMELTLGRRLKDLYDIMDGSRVVGTLELVENKHAKFLNARQPVKGIIRWVLETHAGSPRFDHVEVKRQD